MYGSKLQFDRVDEAIRVVNFIRNKIVDIWIREGNKPKEERKFGPREMYASCAVFAKEYDFCRRLNSAARQASAERAISAVSRYYENCKKSNVKKKGFPKFKKSSRSVEYKTQGWKFTSDYRHIKFTDKLGLGTFLLRGGYSINPKLIENIQRVRIVKKTSGLYLQLVVKIGVVNSPLVSSGNAVALDVGLKEFYTTNMGEHVENPRFLRKSEKKLKRLSRKISKTKKRSKNRKKARRKFGKLHEKVSNQRKDFAVKTARCVVMSNDVVVMENLLVSNMLKNHKLAKSISDASWSIFRTWIERYSIKYNRKLILVNPAWTSQACSCCGVIPKRKLSLKDRIYKCDDCGLVLDRDMNAAINILRSAINEVTAGHAENWDLQCLEKALQKSLKVSGDLITTSSAYVDGVHRVYDGETFLTHQTTFAKDSKQALANHGVQLGKSNPLGLDGCQYADS